MKKQPLKNIAPAVKFSQDPNTRRKQSRTAIAFGGLALVGALQAESVVQHTVEKVVHHVTDNIHQVNESDKFSSFHLSEHLKDKKIDPATVTIRQVSPNDTTPFALAHEMHAKDVRLVADEISAQVGGELSMEPGETVVIPNDQLEQITESAQR